MLRKVAVAAASKPHVEIRQDGDQFYIKTSTTVRTTEINFKVGEGFEEETVDGRKCRVSCRAGHRPGSPYPACGPRSHAHPFPPRPPTPTPGPAACGALFQQGVCTAVFRHLCSRVPWAGESPNPSLPAPSLNRLPPRLLRCLAATPGAGGWGAGAAGPPRFLSQVDRHLCRPPSLVP